MLDEEWRNIPEFPDRFEVSNLGRVRRQPYIDVKGGHRKEKIYKCKDARVGLLIDGKQIEYAVAYLVLITFVGPPPFEYGRGRCVARHLDDDRSNSKVANLAWGTTRDNSQDAVRNNRWSAKSRRKAGMAGGRRTAELGYNSFRDFTPEQRSKYARMGAATGAGGRRCAELGRTGYQNLTLEQRSAAGKKGSLVRKRCPYCDFECHPGNLHKHVNKCPNKPKHTGFVRGAPIP
jgi:hypothetical protein